MFTLETRHFVDVTNAGQHMLGIQVEHIWDVTSDNDNLRYNRNPSRWDWSKEAR
jgi:hypothetical protein